MAQLNASAKGGLHAQIPHIEPKCVGPAPNGAVLFAI